MYNYLLMQKYFYEEEASRWSTSNPDPVVGSYHQHNNFDDYNKYLFPKIDTSNMVALEYGCGPGRNLIRFNKNFKRIDGVDIAEMNLIKAKTNLQINGIEGNNLLLTTGDSVPANDKTYDVVFSVICLQHICVYDIRFKIMTDIHRVLKDEGYFCFQMGYGPGRVGSVAYHENFYGATTTNGSADTRVDDVKYLTDDLEKIGFKTVNYTIAKVGPGDGHSNWIWVQAKK